MVVHLHVLDAVQSLHKHPVTEMLFSTPKQTIRFDSTRQQPSKQSVSHASKKRGKRKKGGKIQAYRLLSCHRCIMKPHFGEHPFALFRRHGNIMIISSLHFGQIIW